MPGVFDQLQRAAFDGIEFACSKVSVKGGMRDHVHEYVHLPGGQPELLGRKLYTISFEATFSSETPLYPNAWPGDLSDLRDRFEQGVKSDLVIPTIGTIKAYAIDWDIDTDFKSMRDGEKMRMTFREDAEEALLIDSVVNVNTPDISFAAAALELEASELGLEDFFTSVLNLANEVNALKDQVELQSEILSDKVGQLTSAVQRLDETLDVLDDPPHYKVTRALHDLGNAAIGLQANILKHSNPIALFVTPLRMSVSDVAAALYGGTELAVQLLKMNPINDAFNIPAGTSLRVYQAA